MMSLEMRGKSSILWLFLCILVIVDILVHIQSPPQCVQVSERASYLAENKQQKVNSNPLAVSDASKPSEEVTLINATVWIR